jgi:biopolymer transport protein ExbD
MSATSRDRRSHYLGTEQKARIEIIPMIDVMMFLLVFFVLIMTEMIQGSGMNVHLPEAHATQPLKDIHATVGIGQTGALTLNGKAVDRQTLPRQLNALADGRHMDLVIAGDKGTPYQSIIDVMDLAHQAGITSIGLATQP